MDIKTLKNDLINTLNGIDKEKLSLMDLRLYTEILKMASEIQTKTSAEMIAEAMSGAHSTLPRPMTLGEMKGDA